MTQPLYLQPTEVALIPGRFQSLWLAMGDPQNPITFTDAQQQLVEEASRTIDDVTGQHGGVLTQTGKTIHLTVRENTDTLWLPNKPLGTISAITVSRAASSFSYDVTGVVYDGESEFITYNAWGLPGQIPSGLMAMTWGMDGVYFPFAEYDRVDVTYDCGFASDSLPATIRDACRRILAEAVFSLQENPLGASEARSGTTQYRFGTQSILNSVDMRTRRALLPYTIGLH